MNDIIKAAQNEARDILASVHAIANCSHIDTLISTTAHRVAEAARKQIEADFVRCLWRWIPMCSTGRGCRRYSTPTKRITERGYGWSTALLMAHQKIMELTKENLVKFLDGNKVVYAENTPHSVPPEGYEMGDEVIESESEENELLNVLIAKVETTFA